MSFVQVMIYNANSNKFHELLRIGNKLFYDYIFVENRKRKVKFKNIKFSQYFGQIMRKWYLLHMNKFRSSGYKTFFLAQLN